jgi:hypothetical protein
MGLYLGTSDLLSGGGASEGTTKEINGYTYSNVITSPKSNLFPVLMTSVSNIYTANTRSDDPNWNNFNASLLGGYNGPTTFTANTDVVIASITNASNGGFVHWAKTPASNFSNALITLKITLDGTTYTFDAKSTSGSQAVVAGDAWADNNRMPGYNASWNSHQTTHPDVFPNINRGYYPSATVARQQSFLGKLYFESSCVIAFNISEVNSIAERRQSGAAITLL